MEGGFSIREYASRMRSINVVNCWPFDESFGEESVKSLLPPIVVKRFTWWLDELEFQTDAELQISENGETSSINARAVKDKCVKGKLRATKKRSIVEIFAVAPPVKRGEDEEEEEEEEDNRASKKKKKKMKKTDAMLKKALGVVKKIKRKKENYLKLKLRTQEKATGNSSLSCSKEVRDTHDFVSMPKRKPRLQDSGPYKKLMPRKSSKSIEKNQNLEFQVRGILKSRVEECSVKQSKKCMLQEAVRLNKCSTKKANKHVTFSEKSDVLRLSRKPPQSVERCKLLKDYCSNIGNVDCAVAVGKDSIISETSGSEDAFARTGKELGGGSATNEQLTTCSVDSNLFEKQKYEGENPTRFGSSERRAMYSVNQHCSDPRLADPPQNTLQFCPPGFPHMPRDGYYYSPKVVMASSGTTRRRMNMNKDIPTARPIFPPLCFEDYLRIQNDASVSHQSNMRRAYELIQATSENTAINFASSIQFQALPHLSPNELLQSFCSPDGSQTGDNCGRSINEEFVGLPLNSQGELIALSSSGKREVNRVMNSNVSGAECIGLSLPSNDVSGHHLEYRNLDSRTSSTSQLNLFPMESYVKGNATMAVLPSRLGITESQSEKANPDFDFLEINYHLTHNPEKTICRGNDQVQKSPENEKFQSTMRLMGKEFEVGRRGVPGFEDRGMWKDKQIGDELHFRNHSVSGHNEPSFRQLGETLFCPSESNYSRLPHLDCQSSSTYKSVFLTRTVDCAQKLYPTLSPGTFSEVYNSNQELRSDMSPGATQLINKQNLHCSPTPSIKFPFMHPDLDSSSWPRRSPMIQHPLCSDVSEKVAQLSNSSISFQPDDFCTFGPFPSGSALQSVAPPPVPYYSGALPVSAMQRKQNNIKERINSRIGVRGIDIGKKSRVPFKRPTVGFHEGHQFAVRKPAARVSFEATVSCSATKDPRFVMSAGEYDQPTKDGRTGTVKLTAGAKHVFKPRHQKDHSSTRAKDQDISLADTNIGFRFSESENPAKIYQF